MKAISTVFLLIFSISVFADPDEFAKLRNFVEQENWTAAEQELNRLQPIYRNSPELRKFRIRILNNTSKQEYRAGRLEQSAQFSRIADDVKYAPIRKLIEKGQLAEAQAIIKSLGKAEREQPTVRLLQAEILVNQGEEMYRAKKFKAAFGYFENAYRVWPNHPLVRTRYFSLRDRLNKAVVPQRPRRPRNLPTPPVEPAPAPNPVEDATDQAPARSINIYIVQDGKSELLTEIKKAVSSPSGSKPRQSPEANDEDDTSLYWLLAGILFALFILNIQIFRMVRKMKSF